MDSLLSDDGRTESRCGGSVRTADSLCPQQHCGKAAPGENRYHMRLASPGVNTAQIDDSLGASMALVEHIEPAGFWPPGRHPA